VTGEAARMPQATIQSAPTKHTSRRTCRLMNQDRITSTAPSVRRHEPARHLDAVFHRRRIGAILSPHDVEWARPSNLGTSGGGDLRVPTEQPTGPADAAALV
jgi:hypothetical protein